ncbi:hypothetical protein B0E53_06613 [Micromonospora sp. MH33]|nr:hypothetical protein B0E53_06613 [Micromonospora sp. MH33]
MLDGRVLRQHPQRTGERADVLGACRRLHEVGVEEQVQHQLGTPAAGEDQRVVGETGPGELAVRCAPGAYAGEPGDLHGLRVERALPAALPPVCPPASAGSGGHGPAAVPVQPGRSGAGPPALPSPVRGAEAIGFGCVCCRPSDNRCTRRSRPPAVVVPPGASAGRSFRVRPVAWSAGGAADVGAPASDDGTRAVGPAIPDSGGLSAATLRPDRSLPVRAPVSPDADPAGARPLRVPVRPDVDPAGVPVRPSADPAWASVGPGDDPAGAPVAPGPPGDRCAPAAWNDDPSGARPSPHDPPRRTSLDDGAPRMSGKGPRPADLDPPGPHPVPSGQRRPAASRRVDPCRAAPSPAKGTRPLMPSAEVAARPRIPSSADGPRPATPSPASGARPAIPSPADGARPGMPSSADGAPPVTPSPDPDRYQAQPAPEVPKPARPPQPAVPVRPPRQRRPHRDPEALPASAPALHRKNRAAPPPRPTVPGTAGRNGNLRVLRPPATPPLPPAPSSSIGRFASAEASDPTQLS